MHESLHHRNHRHTRSQRHAVRDHRVEEIANGFIVDFHDRERHGPLYHFRLRHLLCLCDPLRAAGLPRAGGTEDLADLRGPSGVHRGSIGVHRGSYGVHRGP